MSLLRLLGASLFGAAVGTVLLSLLFGVAWQESIQWEERQLADAVWRVANWSIPFFIFSFPLSLVILSLALWVGSQKLAGLDRVWLMVIGAALGGTIGLAIAYLLIGSFTAVWIAAGVIYGATAAFGWSMVRKGHKRG